MNSELACSRNDGRKTPIDVWLHCGCTTPPLSFLQPPCGTMQPHGGRIPVTHGDITENRSLRLEISNRQDFGTATTTIAIKIKAIGPFCSLLRRVCALNRPEWSTLPNRGRPPFINVFNRPLPWGRLAAAFAFSFLLSAGASSAESWTSVSAATNWSGNSGFVREFSAPVTSRAVALAGTAKLDQLLSLIALAEANNGYDSVQTGARVKPPARPTAMTVRQIYDWIDATPGQPHAIGRYQFIPATLRDLVRQLGVPTSAKFDRRVQDRLALALVAQAGYDDFASKKITASKFMDNLALIWAGLPQADGRSAYHGYAGNRATITRARFEQLFLGVFG